MELQVIRLVCAQLENKQIAVKVKRSLRTIEDYRTAILAKIRTKNTAGMVVYAIKTGICKI